MPQNDRFTEFITLYREVTRRFGYEKQKQLNGIISGSQAMILFRLEREGAQKITGLAEQFGITPGAITSLSDKLISNGLAKRFRTEEDRRVVYLEITDKGRETIQAYRDQFFEVVRSLFEGIPNEDIDHLIRIYKDLLENIKRHQEGQ